MRSSKEESGDDGKGRAPVVRRYLDVARMPSRAASIEAGMDRVFFEAATRKAFDTSDERSRFRERWLGDYLRQDPQWAYVVLDESGRVSGYLVGCLDDPARQARFAELGYFRDFAHLTASFPAHLHINMAADSRNKGLGALLVAAFLKDARRAGVRGVHVVTGKGARNIAFYAAQGFAQQGETDWAGGTVVFLARALATD